MKRCVCLCALLVWAVPVAAQNPDSSGCRRELAATWANMQDMLTRLRGASRGSREERCSTYKHHIEVVSNARAVLSRCKTGRERDGDLKQMDGALDDVHGAIERDCNGH
jgi:hypothetical protein